MTGRGEMEAAHEGAAETALDTLHPGWKHAATSSVWRTDMCLAITAYLRAMRAAGYVMAPEHTTPEQIIAMRFARDEGIEGSAEIYETGIAARPRLKGDEG